MRNPDKLVNYITLQGVASCVMSPGYADWPTGFTRHVGDGVRVLKVHIEAGVYTFQSDLTKLAIAGVFILLTAVITPPQLILSTLIFVPVPFAGFIVVGVLILVIRPVAVLISIIRTAFSMKERSVHELLWTPRQL